MIETDTAEITFIFILILFVDSVNRVYRVQLEMAQASKNSGVAGGLVLSLQVNESVHANRNLLSSMGVERMEVQARKFYSQRNMYLCGFTLFLSLILNRTYIMILDVLRLEEENKRLKGDPASSGRSSEKLDQAGGLGEIAQLKREIQKKDKDIETLKKQSEGLSREYNSLGDKMGQADGTAKKDR